MVKDYLKILSVEEHSVVPKHVQISNAYLRAIENGTIIHGDVLPTSKALASALHISPKLVERIYVALKEQNVFIRVPRKISYTVPAEFPVKEKLIVLFNIFSGPEKLIFDNFAHALTGRYIIDFHVYNNEYKSFQQIVTAALKMKYLKFVIIPSFKDNDNKGYEIINTIPKEKLVIIDQLDSRIKGEFNAVYEDFEKDIYQGLNQLNEQLSKYSTIKLLYPDNCHYPREIIDGFSKYCLEHAFEHSIFTSIDAEVIEQNVVYLCLDENDLILFVDKVLRTVFQIGADIGVVSYHDTLVKKFIRKGITTISIDLRGMGSIAAEMVRSNEIKKTLVPCTVISRPSL